MEFTYTGHSLTQDLWKCFKNILSSIFLFQIAELLLQKGADPDTGDQYSNTPLHRAASKGHVKLVKLLLQFNVDVNYRDSQKSTPLYVSLDIFYEKM